MEVKCKFSIISDEGYVCTIENLSIKNPGSEIIAVKGEHSDGKSSDSVTGVFISKSASVDYFPRGLGKIFLNLKVVSINDCGLKAISRDDLVGLENLEKLHLDNNELTSLPDDLLQDMKKLNTISFIRNKFAKMSSRLLEPIKKQLVSVNFSRNARIHASYDSASPGTSLTLEQLINRINKSFKPKFPNTEFKMKVSPEFERMWKLRRFSDFIISVGSQEFHVHKNVLEFLSSVFAAIFEYEMYQEGKMEIKDFSAAAVEDFLRCLYTGEIQDATNAMELFALASKYDVQALKSTAERIVSCNIDEKNAVEVLNLANLYGSDKMKEKAFEKIQNMFPKIALAAELKNQPEDVEELIESQKNYKRKIQLVEESQERFAQDYAKKMKLVEEEGRRLKKEAKKEFDLMLERFMKQS